MIRFLVNSENGQLNAHTVYLDQAYGAMQASHESNVQTLGPLPYPDKLWLTSHHPAQLLVVVDNGLQFIEQDDHGELRLAAHWQGDGAYPELRRISDLLWRSNPDSLTVINQEQSLAGIFHLIWPGLGPVDANNTTDNTKSGGLPLSMHIGSKGLYLLILLMQTML